jgi:tetratricopeptide (TPR) repeat protein
VAAEDLAAASGSTVDDTLTALDAALRARLVVDAGHGRFALRHALLGEALLARLSSARAARLHRALADRASAAGIELTPVHEASRIAHHHLAARSLDGGAAALPWLERAADHALSLSALQQMRELQQELLSVLEAAPALDPDRRRELRARGRVAYADVWSVGYDSPAVREYARLVRAWQVPEPAHPDDMELLWAATVFENQVGRMDEGSRTVERMAALAARLDDDTAGYLWLDQAAANRWMLGRYPEALEFLDLADAVVARGRVDLRRSLCFSPVTRLALVRALTVWQLGDRDRAFRLADEALAAADAAGVGAAGFARRWGLMLALMDGDAGRVRDLVTLQLADTTWESFRYPSAVVAFAEGWLRARDGDADEGLAAMRAAHAALRDQGLAGGRTVLLGLLAEATLLAGHAGEAVALCDAGLTLAERGERYWVPALERVRAAALGTRVSA